MRWWLSVIGAWALALAAWYGYAIFAAVYGGDKEFADWVDGILVATAFAGFIGCCVLSGLALWLTLRRWAP